MGYMRHHAIVCTSWNKEAIDKAHVYALEVFPNAVSTLVTGNVNEFYTFLVGPDGSKEGWEESGTGDARRDQFVKFLGTFDYEDGSTPIRWVEVQYGDDELETKVVRDSDAVRRAGGEKEET